MSSLKSVTILPELTCKGNSLPFRLIIDYWRFIRDNLNDDKVVCIYEQEKRDLTNYIIDTIRSP